MVAMNGDGLGNGNIIPMPPNGSIDPQLLDPFGARQGKSVLPGFDGMPWRGTVTDRKSSDPEPQIGYEVHCEILDLSIAEHLKHYEEIWQLVANGFAIISDEQKAFVKTSGNWKVCIRWAAMFAVDAVKTAASPQ